MCKECAHRLRRTEDGTAMDSSEKEDTNLGR